MNEAFTGAFYRDIASGLFAAHRDRSLLQTTEKNRHARCENFRKHEMTVNEQHPNEH